MLQVGDGALDAVHSLRDAPGTTALTLAESLKYAQLGVAPPPRMMHQLHLFAGSKVTLITYVLWLLNVFSECLV